jgi:hypothetical protein
MTPTERSHGKLPRTTTILSHARRRGGGVPVLGASAAGRQAADHRVPCRGHALIPWPMGCRLGAAVARTRLDRGPYYRDRVSLGGGTHRALRRNRGRVRPAQGWCFRNSISLTRGDLGPESTVGSASQPSSAMAEAATKSDEASPVEPRLKEISAKPKSAAATSNDSPASPELDATAAAAAARSAEGGGSAVAQPVQAAPYAQPASAPKDSLADCAAPCNQQACPKDNANCLEGGPLSSTTEPTTTDGSAANPAAGAQPGRGTATPADSERAQTRASATQGERVSHRSKRAVQRERAYQPAVAKRNAANGTRWSRLEDRGVEWRRDRTGGRWQEWDADRAWNSPRDGYDDYGSGLYAMAGSKSAERRA